MKTLKKYYYKEDVTFDEGIILTQDLKVDGNLTVHGNIACDEGGKRNINAYNINAYNINAHDINAHDIDADNIDADNIDAHDIDYYAVCFAYNNIKCKSIKGKRNNCKHFCLDGKITIKDNDLVEITVEGNAKKISRLSAIELGLLKE